jgi:hypothetical protein
MTFGRLISGLENRGILLALADGEIRHRSPMGAPTDSGRENLRGAGVVEYFKAHPALPGPRFTGNLGFQPNIGV